MPDITGFTEFVNETETEHGQHIISELLEIIINSNELKMTVNEIEGDAVLFYKLEDVPTFDKILKQTVSIFTKFHQHLKRYEHDRICDCGACSGVSALSLKIIAHTGELGFTTVNNRKKLYGKDMIVVHKLLKNDINLPEYLLLSSDLLQLLGENDESNPELTSGVSTYDKVGSIAYHYLSLTSYLDNIKVAPHQAPERVENPSMQEIWIDSAIEDVHERLTNLKYRTEWNKGLDELKYDSEKVNRRGTIHQCVINDKLIDFETIKNHFNEGEMGFGERLLSLPPGIKSITIYYSLKKDKSGTLLYNETHIVPKPIIGWFFKWIVSKVFTKTNTQVLKAFKEFCETDKVGN